MSPSNQRDIVEHEQEAVKPEQEVVNSSNTPEEKESDSQRKQEAVEQKVATQEQEVAKPEQEVVKLEQEVVKQKQQDQQQGIVNSSNTPEGKESDSQRKVNSRYTSPRFVGSPDGVGLFELAVMIPADKCGIIIGTRGRNINRIRVSALLLAGLFSPASSHCLI